MLWLSLTPDQLALIQYTSGSTSLPKGVMLSHANIAHQLDYIQRHVRLSEQNVSVLWVPHFHDFCLDQRHS